MPVTFRKSTSREYFESIVIAVILALFIRTWVVQAFKIPTGSMEHNLLIGDHLLVNKFVFSPTSSDLEHWILPSGSVDRGDIVVFKFPEEPERDFIKRVIGLPGETFEVRRKRVYIDGELLDEPYLNGQMTTFESESLLVERRDNFGPLTVPDGHYFVMGDNRDNSQDSRFWGPLPHSNLKGKAMLLYWSYAAEQPVLQEPGIGPSFKRITSVLANFFTRTRWERMLRFID